MPDTTTQQVLEIRAALAQALGAAEAALEAARRRYAAARERRDRVTAAAVRQKEKLAAERDARLREIDERHRADLAALAGAVAEAGRRGAPGAAGNPWDCWRPTPVQAGDPVPELRVGRLHLPYDGDVPALVPLLDRGHVVVRGDARLGDDAVAGLLLRAC
jgi:hypothetical protein